MAKFEIGEIAIIISAVNNPHHIGRECKVVSPRYFNYGDFGYQVEINGCETDNAPWFSWESELRKKKPPEELSNWEEIQKLTNWNPSKINEVT